jgi:hypothetical protein
MLHLIGVDSLRELVVEQFAIKVTGDYFSVMS